MVSSRQAEKEKRRVVNACSRCRHHKVKCSGECPCSNCIQRNATCKFDGEGKKVQITKKQLADLYRRNCDLEKANVALQEQLSGFLDSAPLPDAAPITPHSRQLESGNGVDEVGAEAGAETRRGDGEDNGTEEEDIPMVNPLSCGPPRYITDTAGKPHYLGHTSTWSLTIRLLHLTHQALYKRPFPSATLHIDSMTYNLQWNGQRNPMIPDIRGLPSLDHAIFLINATKFHTGQVFHLFHEPTFVAQLYAFYENPEQSIHTAGLWFIHFLAIIALGKAFIGIKGTGNAPPGGEFFMRAFMMLPDYSFLWRDPCTAAELLCSLGLYLQSIDWRVSAHNMISQALRILQVHGYHTDISTRITDEQDLHRCQSIWWTAYVLERQMSVLLGIPLGISDKDISASLPVFHDAVKTESVAIHVKLSQAFSQVVNALYRENEHQTSTFVKSTQKVLASVANVAADLRKYFVVPEQDALNGISRVTGYINLLYHQCIMLATRPFLFILIERRANSEAAWMEIPTPVQLLLQICVESAKKSLFILDSLQEQNLLESFLPFDLEITVSAALVITMASLVSPSLLGNHTGFLGTVSSILNQMIQHGNLIAADQKRELDKLEELCANMKTSRAAQRSGLSQLQERMLLGGAAPIFEEEQNIIGVAQQEMRELSPAQLTEVSDWARDLSPSQLLEVVDMLDTDNLLNWVDLPTDPPIL
ncbi:hypothetical protein BJX63DRAFT_391053 [Aspergillus granulosus]|uniref:Zn(2)-C6 fungal-type domain-containing protein n=1 Tax=Aspergillus granulosus TaxID=176169 RepID=A0ABR4HHM8_9EURO